MIRQLKANIGEGFNGTGSYELHTKYKLKDWYFSIGTNTHLR